MAVISCTGAVEQAFERIVTVRPAFDGRNGSDPKWRTPGMKPDDGTSNTNYGIHGCELTFVLKGPLGATQFVVYTEWMLPHVQEESSRRSSPTCRMIQPMGADVGYHSPKPMYDGQRRVRISTDARATTTGHLFVPRSGSATSCCPKAAMACGPRWSRTTASGSWSAPMTDEIDAALALTNMTRERDGWQRLAEENEKRWQEAEAALAALREAVGDLLRYQTEGAPAFDDWDAKFDAVAKAWARREP